MTPDDIRGPLERYAESTTLTDDERAHLEAMRRLIEEGPAGLSRDRFEPGHFTASALIVGPGTRKVVLIHHAKLDRWLQPGGHLEPGDASLLDAARREVAEEVGLGPEVLGEGALFDLDVHEIPARPQKGEPAHRHFDLRFRFDLEEELALAPASDALDARWVALDEVGALESDASVRRMLAKVVSGSGQIPSPA